jgi:hypothetical protein
VHIVWCQLVLSSFHAEVLVRHYVVVCIVLHQHSDAAYLSLLDARSACVCSSVELDASVLVYAVVNDI